MADSPTTQDRFHPITGIVTVQNVRGRMHFTAIPAKPGDLVVGTYDAETMNLTMYPEAERADEPE